MFVARLSHPVPAKGGRGRGARCRGLSVCKRQITPPIRMGLGGFVCREWRRRSGSWSQTPASQSAHRRCCLCCLPESASHNAEGIASGNFISSFCGFCFPREAQAALSLLHPGCSPNVQPAGPCLCSGTLWSPRPFPAQAACTSSVALPGLLFLATKKIGRTRLHCWTEQDQGGMIRFGVAEALGF